MYRKFGLEYRNKQQYPFRLQTPNLVQNRPELVIRPNKIDKTLLKKNEQMQVYYHLL